MALTDAISVACKALGMSADIYFNKDRSKYDEVKIEKKETVELTQDQFEIALTSDKKGILATLTAYNGQNGKSMKGDYLKALTEQLTKL
jgi:hypothetical protein